MKDNGIVFISGILLEDLEKTFLQGKFLVNGTTECFAYDCMTKIETVIPDDFYHEHTRLRINHVEMNINRLNNYSYLNGYIVFISKDKGKSINRILELYASGGDKRKKLLKGVYLD